jgi:hypothetical protein
LKIVHVDEEAYLNELVTYRLHFEGYKYDQLISKLVEVLVNVLHRGSHVQPVVVATSSWSEHVVTTTEEPKRIRGGADQLAIVSCTLPLSIESMEVFVIVFNTQVKALEELVILKPIPLILPKIGVGTMIILIDSITHTSEVFRTPNIVLKDICYGETINFSWFLWLNMLISR